MNKENNTVGGQAVIEGVMMRSKECVATAIRTPDGRIVVKRESLRPVTARYPLLKLPILRGAVMLIEMLVIGIRALNFSAEIALDESAQDGTNGTPKKSSSLPLGLTMVAALAVGVTVFFAGPLYIATALFDIEQHALAFNLVAGTIRIALLIGYMAGLGMSKELQRVFQYHGAEHKAVFAYEGNAPLTPESAMRFSRFHPRCGTSFLFIVMIVAIVFFSVMDALLLSVLGTISLSLRLATHLPLIPVLAGISYECIKISAKHGSTLIGKAIIAPGLWLQRITTREPDLTQVEVALTALKAAVGADETENAISKIEENVEMAK